jgi:hypothetical protein
MSSSGIAIAFDLHGFWVWFGGVGSVVLTPWLHRKTPETKHT